MKAGIVFATAIVLLFILSLQPVIADDLKVKDQVYNYLPGDANMMAGQWPPRWLGNDITYLVFYFRGINPPCNLDGFYAAADFNGNCSITGADVTSMVGAMRGLSPHGYCNDYIPAWFSSEDFPEDPPENWPGCD